MSMMTSGQLFTIFLVVGLMLFGAEIFVPGGILGTFGGLFLVAAIVAGFYAFPAYAGYVAMGIIVLLGIAITVWIRVFPKTPIGRRMTVGRDLRSSKGTDEKLHDLIGKQGRTLSVLRPAGFALIGGHRIDVVTQGDMIAKDETVEVVAVEGNRVIVEKKNNPEGS